MKKKTILTAVSLSVMVGSLPFSCNAMLTDQIADKDSHPQIKTARPPETMVQEGDGASTSSGQSSNLERALKAPDEESRRTIFETLRIEDLRNELKGGGQVTDPKIIRRTWDAYITENPSFHRLILCSGHTGSHGEGYGGTYGTDQKDRRTT